ncbi:MAG: hypothetical protein AMJ42_03935 [Deltaproteobacteria bacterium DG_8]|nr:MAG: hypothetical protein AMJ42_03935 [Deltaproteobacteria bacterium DG_8]
MKGVLVKVENKLIVGHFELQKNALKIPGNTSFENWLSAGEALHYMEGSIHWWIGDWLNYG